MDHETDTPVRLTPLAVRGGIGGVLMGLANLVPGISGGTMLLAAGIYPRFIRAVGEVSMLRFSKAAVVTLGSVIGAALVSIVLLAGPVKDLVVHHRWVMFSLFIGLTLGGVPVVWRLIGRPRPSVWIAATCGLAGMALLALYQSRGGGGAANRESLVLLFAAGAAGAGAMILPGISGGYLWLLLGVYVPILAAISEFTDALRGGDTATAVQIGLWVLLPVAIGVLIGVVVISNVLRLLLERNEKPTLGLLLGLLIGAVVGLWPFQAGRAPEPGTVLKGQTVAVDDTGHLVFARSGKRIDAEDYPTAFFRPGAGQIAWALGLVVAGFSVTVGIDRVGRSRES